MTVLCVAGSHVIHVLQQTRRFKIISIDNFHNSHPAVYDRLNKIARDALPADATEQDKDSAEIDQYKIDLINAEDVRAVFERYGKGGIWGVIHIAVSRCPYWDASDSSLHADPDVVHFRR